MILDHISSGKSQRPGDYIPHAPPIACLDRVLEVDATHCVTEQLVVDGNGVIDGELWESGLIEGLAQTAAVVNGFVAHTIGRGQKKGLLVGVRHLRLERRARVGELITYRVDVIKKFGPVSLFRCEARSASELVVKGELKFYVEVAL